MRVLATHWRHSTHADFSQSSASPVLVTREAGKNGPLVKRLASAGIQASDCTACLSCSSHTATDSPSQCVEVPLIEHGTGPDRARLPEALRQPWDWVLLTSPEAAAVFLEVCCAAVCQKQPRWLHTPLLSCSQAWHLAGRPTIRIATVGGGTSAVLAGQCPVAFTPSKADAHTLAGACR